MKSVDKSKVEEILHLNYSATISLSQGYYFQFSLGSSDFISYSSKPLDNTYGFGGGTIIIEQKKDNWYLLPSLLTLIEQTDKIVVSDIDKIKTLTYGKSVAVEASTGDYLVVDKYDRVIAFGSVHASRFSPILDLGAYLRLES